MSDRAAELRIDNGIIITVIEKREIIKEGSIVIDQNSIVLRLLWRRGYI